MYTFKSLHLKIRYLQLMQFDCVMAFAHQYDENEDNDCDDYYCYDDIPKVAIVFSCKKKKNPKNIANNKLKISASVIHNIVINLCLCLTVINIFFCIFH